MRVHFEYDMHLQYENRALKARIRELESGAAYVRMQEECEKRCREMEREVRKLKTELENAVRQLRQNREHWFQVYGDMEKEHKKVVERKQGDYFIRVDEADVTDMKVKEESCFQIK